MIRRHGKRHTWLEWIEPVEGPPWVEEVINGVPEGLRHCTGVSLVGRWYARGFSSNEVKKAFHAWNVLNQPPMSKAEVTSILSSTLKWEICRRDAFNVEKFPKMKPKPLTDEELAALPKDLRNEILALRKRNKIKNIGDKNDKIKIR